MRVTKATATIFTLQILPSLANLVTFRGGGTNYGKKPQQNLGTTPEETQQGAAEGYDVGQKRHEFLHIGKYPHRKKSCPLCSYFKKGGCWP